MFECKSVYAQNHDSRRVLSLPEHMQVCLNALCLTLHSFAFGFVFDRDSKAFCRTRYLRTIQGRASGAQFNLVNLLMSSVCEINT